MGRRAPARAAPPRTTHAGRTALPTPADVANAVGPFAAIWYVYQTHTVASSVPVPQWILALGGAGIVVGLATYGYNIIKVWRRYCPSSWIACWPWAVGRSIARSLRFQRGTAGVLLLLLSPCPGAGRQDGQDDAEPRVLRRDCHGADGGRRLALRPARLHHARHRERCTAATGAHGMRGQRPGMPAGRHAWKSTCARAWHAGGRRGGRGHDGGRQAGHQLPTARQDHLRLGLHTCHRRAGLRRHLCVRCVRSLPCPLACARSGARHDGGGARLGAYVAHLLQASTRPT